MSLCKHEGEYPGRNRQAGRQLAGGQCVPNESKTGVEISLVVRLPSGRLYGGPITHSVYHSPQNSSHSMICLCAHSLTRLSVYANGCAHAPAALSPYLFGLQRLSEVPEGEGKALIVPALLKCSLLTSESVCESQSTSSLPEKPVRLYIDPLLLS